MKVKEVDEIMLSEKIKRPRMSPWGGPNISVAAILPVTCLHRRLAFKCLGHGHGWKLPAS